MNFVSPAFLLFLPIVLVAYRIVPRKARYLILLPASYLFYAWHSPALLLLILFATLTSYLCARAIEKGRHRKLFLALQVFVSLGLLFLFKYLDFALGALEDVSGLMGFSRTFPRYHLLLPMGISFYLFQTLSYVIDVYRGNLPCEKHLGYYALYVVFFPQLVAGPIERAGDLLPQLHEARSPSPEESFEGFSLLVRGYAKKVVVADMIAPYVDAAYLAPDAPGSALLFATVLFALQIYGDFSGYTDIARGCARLMGVRLRENFEQPYLAVSVRDFWRRWHMSLTGWFTDYVYIPLGGNRKGTARMLCNTLVVFLLSGLWHGADFSFILWGLLHGLLVIRERLFPPKIRHTALARLRTFCLVTFCWVFFRAASTAQAFSVLRAILLDFRAMDFLGFYGLSIPELCLFPLLALLLYFLPRLPKKVLSPLPYLALLLVILLARAQTVLAGHTTAFLYFQF